MTACEPTEPQVAGIKYPAARLKACAGAPRLPPVGAHEPRHFLRSPPTCASRQRPKSPPDYLRPIRRASEATNFGRQRCFVRFRRDQRLRVADDVVVPARTISSGSATVQIVLPRPIVRRCLHHALMQASPQRFKSPFRCGNHADLQGDFPPVAPSANEGGCVPHHTPCVRSSRSPR